MTFFEKYNRQGTKIKKYYRWKKTNFKKMADMIKQIFKNTHPPQTTIQLSMSSQITNCVNVLPQTTKNCQCSPE
jgi:hypothetical protein